MLQIRDFITNTRYKFRESRLNTSFAKSGGTEDEPLDLMEAAAETAFVQRGILVDNVPAWNIGYTIKNT